MTKTDPNPKAEAAWRTLYAAAIAQAFCYRFKTADRLDDWLGEDALSAATNQLEHASREVASDRGPVDFERWAQACLEVFQAELARPTNRDRRYRARLESHVGKLRTFLAGTGVREFAKALSTLEDDAPETRSAEG